MKRIDLEQGTPEWHEFRRRHIGSSDAASVMRISPYKSYERLHGEKTGEILEREFSNEAIEHGKRIEPIARNHFNERYGYEMKPAVFECEEHPFMSASLDGWDSLSNAALEIKAPINVKNHLRNCERIAPEYNAQLQHQMAVMQIQAIFFISYFEDGSEPYIHSRKVHRDDEFIAKMLVAELEFWEGVKQNKSLHDLLYAGCRQMNSNWDEIALSCWEVKHRKQELLARLKECQKEEDQLQQALIDLSDGIESYSERFELRMASRKGKVQYDQIPELKGVDLDKYRAESSSGFVLKKRRL